MNKLLKRTGYVIFGLTTTISITSCNLVKGDYDHVSKEKFQEVSESLSKDGTDSFEYNNYTVNLTTFYSYEGFEGKDEITYKVAGDLEYYNKISFEMKDEMQETGELEFYKNNDVKKSVLRNDGGQWEKSGIDSLSYKVSLSYLLTAIDYDSLIKEGHNVYRQEVKIVDDEYSMIVFGFKDDKLAYLESYRTVLDKEFDGEITLGYIKNSAYIRKKYEIEYNDTKIDLPSNVSKIFEQE